MTRKTTLSTLLLASLIAMGAAYAQDDIDTSAGAEASMTAEGQVQIAEALADALVAAGAYADTETAMQALFDARAEGTGWGEIAAAHGMDLGLIVADAASEGRSTAGLAIAEENRARGDVDGDVDGDDAALEVDTGGAQVSAGADTAASARTQADVGQGIAADVKANARIDAGLRGTTSGRPVGVGAPTLPTQVTRPILPDRPQRPERPERGGKPGG